MKQKKEEERVERARLKAIEKEGKARVMEEKQAAKNAAKQLKAEA
jgi:hypothetical protein